MKLAMALRTRLFLSFSALITVALLGLVLGVVSVMQMNLNQENAVRKSLITFELSQEMRRNLGDQLVNLISESPNLAYLAASDAEFEQLLSRGLGSGNAQTRAHFEPVQEAYEQFQQTISQHAGIRWVLLDGNAFSQTFNAARMRVIDLQNQAISGIRKEEALGRERGKLIAGLLGVLAVAVLAIGVLTAHSVARRFGAPIEALAKAADNIGQGNFDVVLPVSPWAEMALLSRRFGLMAEALRHHTANNVDELLASQTRLQAVLDSIDYGLVIIDPQGRVEHANPVAIRQLFWLAEPRGRTLGELLSRPYLDDATTRVLRGELLEQAPQDLQIETAGETRQLAWALTPISHNDGRSVGAVMVLRDVTEQRTFERVRSEFVLRASHELRTPVTGMQMAFSLLQERLHLADGSRELDLAETVNEEMARLVQLISDLLNFSRYQNGLQTLELAPVDIADLVEQTRLRHAEAAAAGGLALTAEVMGQMPFIQLDRAQIERVLDNLMANALRHSQAGGTITLQARRHGKRLILSVQDSGEGIDFSQQGRIFEPFVQIGRKKGGAGLGLALCKEIVQLHGGRISLYSRPGEGSQFYMALPL
ncbi:two-component system, NtrC family, sensor histidine kinase KinB [Pseudomonas cuatrocienegasensis]|uniref:histidine kinase n=1 Tax=Pseudomonas cuatrocienegasensis TaxID=543360 RepID=A0ABY1BQH2_9PSED|nr:MULTISPECIES: ATP-binding protein [Pseudomonas]OEC33107.1 PAS domain-containing sensor histidine kinase [Pseudomonas sp. 21C1]SER38177.1 two-component system, NtrC family, sensor histidine kinase KinB [Pseudomonas cuatrocienegasensis]